MDAWVIFGLVATGVGLVVLAWQWSGTIRRTVVARQEDRVRLLALFEGSPLPTWVFENETLRFIEANEAALQQYGYTHDEFTNLTVRDLRVPEEWPMVDWLMTLGESEIPVQRATHRRKDGTRLEVAIHSRPVTYLNRPARLAIVQDITSRLGVERALRESEAQFRAMSEASPAGVTMMTADGGMRYANHAALRMLGMPLERALGDGWIAGVHAEDRERLQAEWRAAAAAREAYTGAGRFLRADFWWRIRTSPIWSGGTCLGHVAVIVDETEQRSADEALRESEERFRQLAEHTPAVVYLAEPRTGSMLFISPAYDRIWGRSSASLYASPWSFLDAVHEEDRDRVRQSYQHRLTRLAIQYRIIRPDGELVWIEDMQFPIRRADGHIYLVAGLAFDVTRRIRLEAQLIESQKMESLGRLAGGVAHDFNNLLTVILSYAELLKEPADGNSEILAGLHEIDTAGQRASALTRQLLTFAQRQVVDTRVVDLNHVLATLEPLLRHLAGDDIKVEVRPDATVPTARLDPNQIDQVVMDLVSNARDAMPQGGTLRVGTATVQGPIAGTSVPEGQFVALTVADTGTGIPPEIRAQVFEPFFTTKPKGQGTGLGLSTAFGIVTQFQGFLELSSQVGLGTEFTCYFPTVGAILEEEPGGAPPAPSAGGHEVVLVVEDEPAVRDVARATLEREGYRVLTAANGIEGLAAAVECGADIDIVVTDIVMPEMSGWEMAERLRAGQPALKILFTSGYNEEIASADGRVGKGVHFLPKPYLPALLTQRVRQILDSP
jgi:two-component system cell cycle sensor histidine kinase/response regulator CckA